MDFKATTETQRHTPGAGTDEKRLREKRLFSRINKYVLGSIVVGGLFAVRAAVGGLKSQGQALDRTGSVLGIMAIFLGLSLVLIIVALIRFTIAERRIASNGSSSSIEPAKA